MRLQTETIINSNSYVAQLVLLCNIKQRHQKNLFKKIHRDLGHLVTAAQAGVYGLGYLLGRWDKIIDSCLRRNDVYFFRAKVSSNRPDFLNIE
jgi:hypothetical protein